MKKHILVTLLLLTVAAGCSKKIIEQKAKLHHQDVVIKNIDLIVDHQKAFEELVELFYGKNGANLPLDQVFIIQDLIKKIVNVSQLNQKQIALHVVKLLQARDSSKSDQALSAYRIDYLQKFAAGCELQKTVDPQILALAQDVIKYIEIEQENIFSNQKNKQIFITAVQRHAQFARDHDEHANLSTQLPELINFWASSEGAKLIYNYHVSSIAKTQMIGEMVRDMTIMLLAQDGATRANSHITAEGQMLAVKISKDSQTIQTNMQSFQKQAQNDQQQKLEAMITAFSNAQKDIQTQTQQASTILNLELDYLYKNISVDKPQQNYIFNQIQFDQLFSLGTMLTPQGIIWKNPFAIGDWEYEKSSNSFWQYQNSPIVHQVIDDTGTSVPSSLQAENNSIFTEYYTTAQSYTIAGTLSIHTMDYPSFTGIIFNKARWISGDFEAIRKCRMVGIYAKSASDIRMCFAQQYTMTDAQVQADPKADPIQTPLQQIINNKASKEVSLPSALFTDLQNKPITFNYEITNSPTSVQVKLWSGKNEPISMTVDNVDHAIYMYHGLGFISPGAIAEFTLTQPANLVFTPQALANYKED